MSNDQKISVEHLNSRVYIGDGKFIINILNTILVFIIFAFPILFWQNLITYILILIGFGYLYWAPTIICFTAEIDEHAEFKNSSKEPYEKLLEKYNIKHPNRKIVFWINLLFGNTIIGWFIAFHFASSKEIIVLPDAFLNELEKLNINKEYLVETPTYFTQENSSSSMNMNITSIFCTKCGESNLENNLKCTQCGHPLRGTQPQKAVAVTIDDSNSTRMMLPVGRSSWAIASGYLGLFSVLLVFAPFALLSGIFAVKDIQKNSEKHGMGRAIFGIVMGALGSVFLLIALVSAVINTVIV